MSLFSYNLFYGHDILDNPNKYFNLNPDDFQEMYWIAKDAKEDTEDRILREELYHKAEQLSNQ